MATQRVYVIWRHPLFLESVRLLLKHPEIEWLGESSNSVAAQSELLSLQPDYIIIEEIEGGIPSNEMDILRNSYWVVCLIGLSLDDNHLNVYHREQRKVVKADDLLSLILDNTA